MQVAYIGMGANIASPVGSPETTLVAALDELSAAGTLVCSSSLYSTAPVGLVDQPRFLNAVVALETSLLPRELLPELLRIERVFGRDRSSGVRNGPRPLDLDLLMMGDEVADEPGLQLPHPRLQDRAFVLIPLAEIAPDRVIVTLGKTVKELLQALRTRLCDEDDAILPLQNDVWHAGPCGRGGVGTIEPDAHDHR